MPVPRILYNDDIRAQVPLVSYVHFSSERIYRKASRV